jgi:hypothetical protein
LDVVGVVVDPVVGEIVSGDEVPVVDRADEQRETQSGSRAADSSPRCCAVAISAGAIARVVVKASESNKPRLRYHPNKDARGAILTKGLAGDALLDRVTPRITIR